MSIVFNMLNIVVTNTWYITAALYHNDISKRSTLVIDLHKLFWVFAPWSKAPKWVTFYSLMMHSFYSYTYTWSFSHTEDKRTDFIFNFVIILLIHTCMILFPCEGMESRFILNFVIILHDPLCICMILFPYGSMENRFGPGSGYSKLPYWFPDLR